MKKLKMLLVFMSLSLCLSAYTENELYQENLTNLGVSQNVINETLAINDEIGDKILIGQGKDYIPKLEELLKKDQKNYVVIDLINVHNTLYDKATFKKSKKLIDQYGKYVPYEYEKISALINYYRELGNTKQVEKYLEEINQKYPNSWVSVWLSIKAEDGKDVIKDKTKQTLDLMEASKNDKSQGISDELIYYIRIIYNNMLINDAIAQGNPQKVVDLYINNIGNPNVSENVIKKYKHLLAAQFNAIGQITSLTGEQKVIDKNVESLKNTKIYKVLGNGNF